MKFDHYLKKVEESREFKKFRKSHKKSHLCAGFFVLDLETGKDMHQLDYYLPNGKVATFSLDGGVKIKISEQAIKKRLPKIKGEIKTDLDALKGIVEDEMKNRTVTEAIKKIIAVVYISEDKPEWKLQCILNGLGLLNVHINDSDQKILKFEKISMLDLIRPASSLMMLPKDGKQEGEKKEEGKAKDEETIKKLEKDIEKQLKQPKKQKKAEELFDFLQLIRHSA